MLIKNVELRCPNTFQQNQWWKSIAFVDGIRSEYQKSYLKGDQEWVRNRRGLCLQHGMYADELSEERIFWRKRRNDLCDFRKKAEMIKKGSLKWVLPPAFRRWSPGSSTRSAASSWGRCRGGGLPSEVGESGHHSTACRARRRTCTCSGDPVMDTDIHGCHWYRVSPQCAKRWP